jgi:ubiquinone/menaquinone biosynthesis C-methylase UbiE
MDRFKYWDKKQAKYEKLSWIDKPTSFAKFAVKFFPKSGHILELGGGQGSDARFFAKAGYNVLCTDFSKKALKIAEAKTGKLKIKFQNLDLAKGKLPFKDESFEIVYASLSLHYFDEKTTQKLFNEIHRILKPKGVFAMMANSMDDPEITNFEKIDKFFYRDDLGLTKRYFTVQYLEEKLKGKFETRILDNKGTMHLLQKTQKLIRFIGVKK